MVLAAVVVVVALAVVAVGTLGARSSGGVTVTGGHPLDGRTPAGSTGDPGERATPSSTAPPAPSSSASSSASSPAVVAVYVLGAVVRAGVVEVPAGTRVEAVLERAGGATADADLARLNLARPVVDGERLYVPRVGETALPEALVPDVAGASGGSGGGSGTGAGGAGGSGQDVSGGVVDLNTADQATLETLPGIGPALAERIVAWREEHGGFSAVEDLLEVSGIGDGRFAELRERVRV